MDKTTTKEKFPPEGELKGEVSVEGIFRWRENGGRGGRICTGVITLR